jgi:hypothetical protein
MTNGTTGGNLGGIGLGGILVIVGILLAIFWSVWVGIIIALIGLIAFGGFARGRWYLAAARNEFSIAYGSIGTRRRLPARTQF